VSALTKPSVSVYFKNQKSILTLCILRMPPASGAMSAMEKVLREVTQVKNIWMPYGAP
jgi:hypothetical protein